MKKIIKFLLAIVFGALCVLGMLPHFDIQVTKLWGFRADGLLNLFGMLGVAMGFVAMKGADGSAITGGPDLRLGPCNVYIKTELQPLQSGTASNLSAALTGTVAVAPISGTTTSTVTGTSTTFIADLVKNQMVVIGTNNEARVIKINSDTSIVIDRTYTIASGASIKKALTTVTGVGTSFLSTLKVGQGITYDGITFGEITAITSDTSLTLKAPSVALNSTAYRSFRALLLGGTSATTVKYSVKKGELKKSQYGESAANRVITGADCSIEVGMVETSIQRLEATMQGFLTKRDNTGAFTGTGLGLALGESDADVKFQVSLVRLVGVNGESSNPLDTWHFPACAPQVDAEWKYDASSQLELKNMFNVYRSEDVTYNGIPLFAYNGDLVT